MPPAAYTLVSSRNDGPCGSKGDDAGVFACILLYEEIFALRGPCTLHYGVKQLHVGNFLGENT